MLSRTLPARALRVSLSSFDPPLTPLSLFRPYAADTHLSAPLRAFSKPSRFPSPRRLTFRPIALAIVESVSSSFHPFSPSREFALRPFDTFTADSGFPGIL